MIRKKIDEKGSGNEVDAAIKAAWGDMVKTACLAPDELNYAARVIAGFTVMPVTWITNGSTEEPHFPAGDIEELCSDKVTDSDGCITSEEDVPEYIREGSLSPKVAEVLVSWFHTFYLPKLKSIPHILREMQSKRGVWEWLVSEAEHFGTTAEDWVKSQVFGQPDRLLVGVIREIGLIKILYLD